MEALALTAQSAVEDPARTDLVLSGERLQTPQQSGVDYRESFRPLFFKGDISLPLSVGFEWAPGKSFFDSGVAKAAVPAWYAKGVVPRKPRTIGYRWVRRGRHFPQFEHSFSVSEQSFLEFGFDTEHEGPRGATHRYHVASRDSRNPTEISKLSGWDRLLAETLPRDLAAARTLAARALSDSAAGVDEIFIKLESDFLELMVSEMHKALKGVQFLASLRGASLMHGEGSSKISAVGRNGENTVRLLASVHAKTNPDLSALRRWAKKFGLPDIDTAMDGRFLHVLFSDPQTGTPLELGQAATGSVQGLTMAAQLLLAQPGSTLLIEEPETNLHPAYERLLPALFGDAVKGGRQVIASTHSEVLVAALGAEVRRGNIKPADVAIWHLERGADGIRKERLRIDGRGYLSEWVKSFAEVEEGLFDEWAESLAEVGDKADRGHARNRGGGKAGSRQK